MLRDAVEEIPSKCLFLSPLYILGDRFHDFPSIFWVNLLPCAPPVHEVRFSSSTLTLTSEHELITHFSTSSLLPFQAGKADCIWHSIFKGFVSSQWHCSSPGDKVLSHCRNPGVQCLANSSDFLISFWLHLVLPGFPCSFFTKPICSCPPSKSRCPH